MDFDALINPPFLIAIIFILAAAVTYVFPPQKINSFYGYRTRSSMKSEEIWRFAQRFSAIALFQSGLIMIVVAALANYFPFSDSTNTAIIGFVFVAAIAMMFIRTEKAIKRSFIKEL